MKKKRHWFVAVLVQAYRPCSSQRARSVHVAASERIILLRAETPGAAYAKAVALGHQEEKFDLVDNLRQPVRSTFIGLSDLLPVYDPMTDEVEILSGEAEDTRLDDLRASVVSRGRLLRRIQRIENRRRKAGYRPSW